MNNRAPAPKTILTSLQPFVIFAENELLEISVNLGDDEISFFIEETRNVHAIKMKKTDLNILIEQWTLAE